MFEAEQKGQVFREEQAIPSDEFDWNLWIEDYGNEQGVSDKVIELTQFLRSPKNRETNRNEKWIDFVVQHADELRGQDFSRLQPGEVPIYLEEALAGAR